MNSTAIKVSHLTKIYKLYDKPVDRLKESLHPLKKQYHKEFYALNDINFEIKKGETVGIIGKNGAGKSTLLKIITGVLTPTSGSVHVNGRIASLLELGAGFNPEYTGVENIYFQGSLMGYTREEMEVKVDDIVQFADIGDFVHQPVKMYSSGMFARLAFAVAINVDPDVLIVDEALSVGDMYFQQKCMDKINSMRSRKMTLLFVSHSIGQVKKICEKAVFIENGTVIAEGESQKVCDLYLNKSSNITDEEKEKALLKAESNEQDVLNLISSENAKKYFREDLEFINKYSERSGGKEIEFTALDIYDENNRLITELTTFDKIKVIASYITNKDINKGTAVGLLCRDTNGNDMFALNSNHAEIVLDEISAYTKGIIMWEFSFPLLRGLNAQYTFSIGIKPEAYSDYYFDRIFNALIFTVNNPKIAYENAGLVYVQNKLHLLKFEDSQNELYKIDKKYFLKDETNKKYLFKKLVKMIEIEPHSYCNRTCWFCPNSYIDRKRNIQFLDKDLLENLLNDLKSIDYSEMITFTRYSEPFGNKIFFETLYKVSEILPQAFLHTNTNGDFLNNETLLLAYESGLRSLNIQIYLDKNEEFNFEIINKKALEIMNKLSDVNFKESIIKNDWIEYPCEYKNMNIRMYSRDFNENGINRSDIVFENNNKVLRYSPCLLPFTDIYIDFNGKIVPCCHIRSDNDKHKEYVVGDLNTEPLFDIYFSDKMIAWRKKLFNYNLKNFEPCKNCNFREIGFEEEKINYVSTVNLELNND